MTKQKLQQLYKSEILPENENPYHFQEPLEASFSIEAYNSICGDKYTLYFDTNEGQIRSVFFYGMGCALSKASISIMCKNIENLNAEDITDLSNKFIKRAVWFELQLVEVLSERRLFGVKLELISILFKVLKLINRCKVKK